MKQSHIYCIFILKEYLTNIFGVHYPKEIIALCITKIYKQIKTNCGTDCITLILNRKTYICGILNSNTGYLLHNDTEYYPGKLIIEKPDHSPIQLSKIKCYRSHTIALTTQSELYIWGNNNNGQLGLGDDTVRQTPHKLLSNIKKINGGYNYTIILTKLNEIYVWGANYCGQLGLGDNQGYNSPQKLLLPDVNSINCGDYYSIALVKNSNKLYVWGLNSSNQLGLGLGYGISYNKPMELFLPSPILKIACGGSHTIALSKDNKLFVWGNNGNGELGLGDRNMDYTIHQLILNNIISIKCGEFHTIALTKQGDVYGWGYNFFYQSESDPENMLTPQKISLSRIISISCGSLHTIAVTIDNDVYVWGRNKYDQSGLKDNKPRSIPCQLKFQ